MEKRKDFDRAKRLLAYSAAAGLGAFGTTQGAQASIVYVDIPDVVISEGGAELFLDMNSDGFDDARIRMLSTGPWYTRFHFDGQNGTVDYTNIAKGNANYIRSFEAGDIIGLANPNAVPTLNADPIAHSNTLNFGDPTDPQYAGILLMGSGGDTHWGWVRMRYFRDGVAPGIGYAEVYDYAYETDPSSQTDIIAGAPEPGALSLLAAGAGALAFKRRRS